MKGRECQWGEGKHKVTTQPGVGLKECQLHPIPAHDIRPHLHPMSGTYNVGNSSIVSRMMCTALPTMTDTHTLRHDTGLHM